MFPSQASNSNCSSDNFMITKAQELCDLDSMIDCFADQRFECQEDGCCFRTDGHRLMLIHEIRRHRSKAPYYCKKCGGNFTKKAYLNYHLYEQNRGIFACFKCREVFEFQHLLDRHLLQHSQSTDIYKCTYCGLEFLSAESRDEHYKSSSHDQETGPRKLITIDHSMDIVNDVPMSSSQLTKRESKIEIKIMNLPKTPSRRPRSLHWHQPYRLFLGYFDEPNCSGNGIIPIRSESSNEELSDVE